MKRLLSLLVAAGALAAGWFVLQEGQKNGWQGFSIPGLGTGASQAPPARGNNSIRVATFNIQVFGESKLNDPDAMAVIVSILRNFDVVAIQEVRAISQDIMPQVIRQLNADGRQYDYAIGPRLGRTASKEQYAFLFDTETIEMDRYQLYTVDDPDDLLHREPLVGWFRARGPSPEQAFTFSLVTIHTDPDETNQELDVLDDVFFKVRDDRRRGEDDVLLVGDLNAKASNLRQLGQVKGLARIVSGETPTNTLHNAQYDNILFDEKATTEFTGRGGVFDFLRQFNLTLEQAKHVSDHLPVWAEFSVYEGGGVPVATRTDGAAAFRAR